MSRKSSSQSSESDIEQVKQTHENEQQNSNNNNKDINIKEIYDQNNDIIKDNNEGNYQQEQNDLKFFRQIQKEESKQEQTQQKQCSLCLKVNDLLRCSACKQINYCSIECQKLDWQRHKLDCKKFQEEVKNQKDQDKRRSIEEFNILGIVGTGNFSDIYRIEHKQTKQIYALKQINKRRLSQVNKELDVFMEKHCLSQLADNPYVIKLYSTFQDSEFLYVQMELVQNGELWKQIHVFGAIGQSLIKYYFGHIIKGISLIHSKGIIHRDIKSENIIIGQDNCLKFIDFGTARDLNNPQIKGSGNGLKGKRNYEHFVGTPQFMAPECIRNRGSDYKSDIYSLGCLFYQIISGNTPFEDASEYLIFTKALEQEIKFPNDWIFQQDQIDLIKLMTIKNMENRCSLEDVMNHPYWGSDWNWDKIQDYEIQLQQLTPIEKFLQQIKYQLYQSESDDNPKEQEIRIQQILNNNQLIINNNELDLDEDNQKKLQMLFHYMERQSKLLIKEN